MFSCQIGKKLQKKILASAIPMNIAITVFSVQREQLLFSQSAIRHNDAIASGCGHSAWNDNRRIY